MIRELSALYTGSLAWLRGYTLLAADAPAGVVAARDVFTPAGLDRMIELHATNYPPGDRRAVLSIWSKYYLAAVIYTPVAAMLMVGRTLPVALDDIGLILGENGEVRQLVVPHAGEVAPEVGTAARFLPLIDANLGPAIETMAAHSGLSPRVYWSNAGHYFDHLARTLSSISKAPSAAHDAAGMMQLRHLADGRRNPLFRPFRTMTDVHGEEHRMRRLCCIQFRLQGAGYCDNCPLIVDRSPTPNATATKLAG